jgi:predicted nucleic acid-binding protein
MSVKVFVDTNILVYARDAPEPDKQARAADWMATLWKGRVGRLSYQLLQEFYLTVTGKLLPGLDNELARRDVRALWAWQPIATDFRVLEGAWLLQDRYRLP